MDASIDAALATHMHHLPTIDTPNRRSSLVCGFIVLSASNDMNAYLTLAHDSHLLYQGSRLT